MSNGTQPVSISEHLSDEALDRIVIAVAHHAELAQRSAVRRDHVGFRRWILRRARQTRVLNAWGLL